MTCAFRFEGAVRTAIHQLKYRGAQYLAKPLAIALVDCHPNLPADDLVVPVPLHPARLSSRGYNQSALLARALASYAHLDCLESGLTRVRDTPPQVSLPAAQRWLNVRDAFAADGPRFSGRRLLLVDDVATTTGTLRAAARALLRAGATRVDALVIARATPAAPAGGGTFDASPRS